MASISQPAATRAIAVDRAQPLALTADGATDWWQRNLTTGGPSGAWSQINGAGAVQTIVWTTPTSVTNRLTFDRLQLAVNTGSAPSTGFTGGLHLNLCEGPVAVLCATDSIRNEAHEEPPMRPWDAESDDPPHDVALYMPGANRDRLGTVLLETIAERGGPANLVHAWGPGLYATTAGKLCVRTPFTNDVRGLGPFPAIAAYHHGGMYFQHDFGKSRTLALTRVLYEDADGHVAIVRGDGRRNTYRSTGGGAFTAAASLENILAKSGGIFTETSPSGRVYRYTSAGRLDRVVDRCGNPVYYAYDGNDRLQKIQGLFAGALGLVPYLSYDGNGLLERLVLEDPTTPANNRVSYFQYDAARNLTRVIGPESCITYFGYSGDDLYLTSVTDPEGYVWQAGYDSGRVDRVVDALSPAATAYLAYDPASALTTLEDRAGKVTYFQFGAFGSPERVFNVGTPADYFAFDGEGNLTSTKNRLGREWTYEYDDRANRIAVNDPLGARTYFAYDGQDLLRTHTDPLGRVTSMGYDGQRNRTSWSDPLGKSTYYEYEPTGLLRQKKDRRGALTYFGWDDRADLTKVHDPLGNTTYFAYNTANEQTARVDPLGRISYLEHDKRGRVTKTLDPLGAPSYMAYDARCNLVSQKDARLNETTLLYDGNSNRTRVVDALGNPTYFGYDPEERLASQKNARLFETTWAHDALGRRQTQTDALGGVTTWAHDDAHQVERQVNARGNASYMAYDAVGRPSHRKDANLDVTYTGYDLAGQTVLALDARLNPTYFEYDPRGWQRQTKDALGAVRYLTFDDEGNRERSIDPRGLTTYFTYDLAGRPTHTKDQLLGVTYTGYDEASQAVLRLDELGWPTYMTYDLAGRTQTTLDPCGLLTYHAYDPVGNTLHTAVDQAAARATTYFAYDAINRRTSTKDALGGISTTVYDAVGNVERSVDARGFATYHTYDALDRRTHSKDPVHFASTYLGYDPVGNVLLQVDPLGVTTYLTYDRLERAALTHDPAGALTYHAFDAVGNRTATHVLLGAGGERRSSYFEYDAVNRTSRQLAPDGGATVLSYDLAGNQTHVVDPVGRPTYTAYDELNRTRCTYNAFLEASYLHYDARSSVSKQIDPVGRTTYMGYDCARRLLHQSNALGEFSYFSHDLRGNRTAVRNPRGYTTYLSYDLLDRQTHRKDALLGISYLGYDATGNRVVAIDELGKSTYFTYDGLGRATHTKDQAGGITYLGYDARSSVVLQIDGDGRATYLTHDAARRLERETFTNPLATADLPRYFTYDQASNLKTTDDSLHGLGVSSYDYDTVDRLLKKSTLAGGVYYGYDLSGRKTWLMDRDLTQSYYVYDSAGRLEKVEVDAGRTAYYLYDQSGMQTRRTLPGDAVQAYWAWDRAGRLESLVNRNPTEDVLSSFEYTRDANGQITKIVREVDNVYYEYDALDRLTSEKHRDLDNAPSADFRYSFDAASNRLVQQDAMSIRTEYYSYDSRNLLQKVHVVESQATNYFEYDAAQRMTSSRMNDGNQSAYFSHDQRDMATRIDFARGVGEADTTRRFSHTGAGERVFVEDGDVSYWTYDGPNKVLVERGPTSTLRRYRHNAAGPRSERLGNTIERQDSSNQPYFLYDVTDHRGDVRKLTSQDHLVRQTRDNKATGDPLDCPFDAGDGSDGNVTLSGAVALTGDEHYNNLTIQTGAVVLVPAHQPVIRCRGDFTLEEGATLVFSWADFAGPSGGAGTQGRCGAASDSASHGEPGRAGFLPGGGGGGGGKGDEHGVGATSGSGGNGKPGGSGIQPGGAGGDGQDSIPGGGGWGSPGEFYMDPYPHWFLENADLSLIPGASGGGGGGASGCSNASGSDEGTAGAANGGAGGDAEDAGGGGGGGRGGRGRHSGGIDALGQITINGRIEGFGEDGQTGGKAGENPEFPPRNGGGGGGGGGGGAGVFRTRSPSSPVGSGEVLIHGGAGALGGQYSGGPGGAGASIVTWYNYPPPGNQLPAKLTTRTGAGSNEGTQELGTEHTQIRLADDGAAELPATGVRTVRENAPCYVSACTPFPDGAELAQIFEPLLASLTSLIMIDGSNPNFEKILKRIAWYAGMTLGFRKLTAEEVQGQLAKLKRATPDMTPEELAANQAHYQNDARVAVVLDKFDQPCPFQHQHSKDDDVWDKLRRHKQDMQRINRLRALPPESRAIDRDWPKISLTLQQRLEQAISARTVYSFAFGFERAYYGECWLIDPSWDNKPSLTQPPSDPNNVVIRFAHEMWRAMNDPDPTGRVGAESRKHGQGKDFWTDKVWLEGERPVRDELDMPRDDEPRRAQ